MKIRVSKEDTFFSKLIRERDGGCVFCGKTEGKLENSHFWGRGAKSVRFDPENCDTLCFHCHMTHEGSKQGFYREWKLAQLGQKRYQALEKRAKQLVPYGKYEKAQILAYMKSNGLDGLKEFLFKLWKSK